MAKPRRLPKLLKRGEELNLLDYFEVLACCERSRGHKGAKPLTGALAAYRPEGRVTRSDVERDFLALVQAAGLPLPATNYIVGPFELDAYWPVAGLAVELDTYGTHGTRASFESDRERDAELAAVGITVIRVTDRRLEREPEAIARQLAGLLRPAAVLRRRASRPSPV
ncbi:MAG TPA: hypothetical protein VGI73_13120 [Solirubrobacterales bacterium]